MTEFASDPGPTETRPNHRGGEADVFAGYFLVPETVFAAALAESRGLPLVDRVFKLKRIFRVWRSRNEP